MGMIDGPNLYAYSLNDPVNYFDPYGNDTYRINNEFNRSTPTTSLKSHSFVATTDIDPITGKETVMETYSWVDTNGGMWEDTNRAQNKEGAQRAIDSNIGAWKKGGESLDKYVKEIFEQRKGEQGGFWPWTRKDGEPFRGNCKQQANKLIKDALKKQELDKVSKK